MKENKKKSNFNIEYRKVKRAERIEKIEDNAIVSILWSNTDTSIYTTLLSLFNSFGAFTVSYDYLSGECKLTNKTINKSVLKMKNFGIVTIEQSNKRSNGCFAPNRFVNVIDLEQSTFFKCVTNKYKKLYDKKKKDRFKRLQYLQGVVISNNWIEAQCRNYWRNTNWELITGEFLQGDKTEKLLYQHDKVFTPYDDLKQYEIDNIINGQYTKEEKENEDTL